MKSKNKISFVISYADYLFIALFLAASIYYAYYGYKYYGMIQDIPQPVSKYFIEIYRHAVVSNKINTAQSLICLLIAVFVAYQRIIRIKSKNIVSRLEWTVERLGHLESNFVSEQKNAPVPGDKWPWGGHHTEALGNLEAAARRFWSLYDPADPSSAPTNEMVSTWLREERMVSKEKAAAIASILRADGLRMGPRR